MFDLKKRFMGVIIIISFITVGCIVANDTVRPFNYPPAKWISDTPDVSFVVSDENYNECVGIGTYDYILDGQLNLDGEIIKMEVCFDPGRYVYFYDKSNSSHIGIGDSEKSDFLLFAGACKFGPDKLVVTIEEDKVFERKYNKITFERIPEEATPIDDDLQ